MRSNAKHEIIVTGFFQMFKYHHLYWFFLFLGSFLIRLIGIGYGLPYEHNTDEQEYFNLVDNALDEGSLDPGIQIYGYVFYYLIYFTSFIARVFVDVSYIREYEILFFRILIAIITSFSVVIIYEIARRVYDQVNKPAGNKFLSLMPAAFLAGSAGAVTLAHFSSSDNVVALFLYLTVLFAVSYIKTKNRKALVWTAILAGLTMSSKFSYGMLAFYPVLIYLLVNGFKITRRKLLTALKYISITGITYILLNLLELPHLKSWIGRNLYIIQAYNSSSHFYFKSLHENYFDSLLTGLKFISSDFYINTGFSLLISAIVLPILLLTGFKAYKANRTVFLAVAVFPILFLVLSAKASVFQLRTLLGIAPLLAVIFFYPMGINKSRVTQIIFGVALLAVIFTTVYRFKDVEKHQVEKQLMSFIEEHEGVFLLPNIFYYPQIEYAYHNPTRNLNFKEYPFFQRNNQRLIFYQQAGVDGSQVNVNIEDELPKADYFVIQKQSLQAFFYEEANRLRSEPKFEPVDISPEMKIDEILAKQNFQLVTEFKTSDYETIIDYEPSYLGAKQFFIYKRVNKQGK